MTRASRRSRVVSEVRSIGDRVSTNSRSRADPRTPRPPDRCSNSSRSRRGVRPRCRASSRARSARRAPRTSQRSRSVRAGDVRIKPSRGRTSVGDSSLRWTITVLDFNRRGVVSSTYPPGTPSSSHSAPADRCDRAAPAPAHASAAANSDRHVGGTPARRKLPGWRRTKRPVSTRRLIALGPSPAVSASCAPTTPKCSAATRSQARSASDIAATSRAVDDDDVAPATPVHAPRLLVRSGRLATA